MQWLTENPWPVAILCGLAALVFVGIWSSNKRAAHLLAALVCLLIGASLFVIEGLIQTDAERVEQDVHRLVDAFERKDLEQVNAMISPQLDTLRTSIATAAKMVDVKAIRVSDLSVEMREHHTRAISQFRANGEVVFGGSMHHAATRWRITWERDGEKWIVTRVVRLDPIRNEEVGLLSH
ncbi:MAG TPA: hypothetical protein VHB77_20560 [Planctomycetaceae bacterium]|nr:hypothetical protein [Planctomycetaceae bacterium]